MDGAPGVWEPETDWQQPVSHIMVVSPPHPSAHLSSGGQIGASGVGWAIWAGWVCITLSTNDRHSAGKLRITVNLGLILYALGMSDTHEYGRQFKHYGRLHALTVEACQTRSGCPTVVFEAASRTDPSFRVDWQNKLSVQLTEHELTEITAVVLGLLPEAEYRHHGPAHNKGCRVIFQPEDASCLITVFSPETGRRAVRINRAERVPLAHLLLEQIICRYPGTSMSDMLTLLRCTY